MSPTQTPTPTPAQTAETQIDAYISMARPFAQPILVHLRELIHQACPNVVETMKWSRPFFEHQGVILANMSAFKEHCSFGFWGEEISMVLRDAKLLQAGAMGSLGRITHVEDLPADEPMLRLLSQAAQFIEGGQHTSPIAARIKVAKSPAASMETPPDFQAALQASKKAAAVFTAFSPSCRKEYIQWIAGAKRSETRDKRIATAIEWISEGKQHNWRYQQC